MGSRSRRTIYKIRDRPGVSTSFYSYFLVPRNKGVRECTYLIVRELYEGITTRLAAQRASLMKEVVEAHEFAKLGEDLDECVSGERKNRLWIVQGLAQGQMVRTHPLLDEGCQRIDGS